MLFAAHQLDEPGHVVRDVPAVLPARPFGDVAAFHVAVRVERRAPVALRVLPAHQAGGGIEDVAEVGGALPEGRRVVGLAECLRHHRHAPIVVRVLQGLRDGLVLLIERDPAELRVGGHLVVVRVERRGADRSVSALRVEAGHALLERVDDHGHRVIPDHAPGLVRLERPHRQQVLHALVVVREHGVDHVGVALCLDQGKERMRGAVRVPEREDGVVRELLRPVDVLIQPAVLTVHVFEELRGQERMIHRRVERLAFRLQPRRRCGQLLVLARGAARHRIQPGICVSGSCARSRC